MYDDSQKEIRVTLWGSLADNFSCSPNAIVAIKSVRVGEYNGGTSLADTRRY